MDGQGARVVEENLAPGTEHPLDGLIHGVVQRSSPLAGVRQQPIAFGTHMGREFERLLDHDADQIFTIIGAYVFNGTRRCIGARIVIDASSRWSGNDFNSEHDNTVLSVFRPFCLTHLNV